MEASECDPVRIIDLFPPWTTCHMCGKDTVVSWGVPIDADTGEIVPTWFEGLPGFDWGGVPVCKGCYERHQEWSERIARPFDAPLA